MDDPLAPFRRELRGHCYRMLGSYEDAEDALQEVSVRAWRGRPDFQGRSSLRTWLHRIAVNVCLNELARKERRVLPVDLGPASVPHASLGEPLHEVLWLGPYPDDPEQRATDRETVELAFVAAVQHLSANERAALIMFDVLGFSAQEIAEAMDTSRASVNSALQRARAYLHKHLPEPSQQSTLAELGDAGQRELVSRYVKAIETNDLDGILALLTEDATWSMPPLASWFEGHEAISAFLTGGPFTVRWRHMPIRANAQLAVGCYWWDEAAGAYVAAVIDVLQLRGSRIGAVTGFIGGERFAAFGLPPQIVG